MTWYFNVLAFVLISIVINAVLKKMEDKIEKERYETGDGYKVTFDQVKPFLEYQVDDGREEFRVLYNFIRRDKSDFIVTALVSTFLVYGMIESIIWLIFHTSFYLSYIVLGLIIFAFVKNVANIKKEMSNEFKKLIIETPTEYAPFGKYVQNPFDIYVALKRLKKDTLELESATTTLNRFKFNREQHGGKRYPISRLKKYESDVNHLSGKVTVLIKSIQNDMVSDYPSSLIQDILNSNKLVLPIPEVEKAPPYLEVLRKISINDSLPDEVREEARTLIETHETQEVDEKKKAEIDEALVEIKTVKKILGSI
ncbi:hypothetical protein [Rossellomorea marisflavi]|uniref:hypothetical protein n=1 Tax=Rossellomorea marisflavi TaxID=189381 RepID=UPI003FA0B516